MRTDFNYDTYYLRLRFRRVHKNYFNIARISKWTSKWTSGSIMNCSNKKYPYIPEEIIDDIPLSLWRKIKQLLNRKEKNEEKFIHHWIDWKLTIQFIVHILGFIVPTIWLLTRMWFGTHAFAGNLWIDLYNYERNVHFSHVLKLRLLPVSLLVITLKYI